MPLLPAERSLRAVCVVLRVLLTPLCTVHSHGSDLPPSGPVLVAANHISVVDPVVLAVTILAGGRVPRFLARPGLLTTPVVGPLLRHLRQLPAERGSGGYELALSGAVDTLRRRECVVIYPEGGLTRREDVRPGRGHHGAAWLAATTGAPVVPAGSWGAQHVWRFGRTDLLRWPPRRARAVVSFGDAVAVPPLARGADLEEVTEAIMRAVAEQVERASTAEGPLTPVTLRGQLRRRRRSSTAGGAPVSAPAARRAAGRSGAAPARGHDPSRRPPG